MFGLEWYLVPIVLYLIFYAVVYFGPLVWRVATSSPGGEVETLERRIETEVRKEQEQLTADYRGTSAAEPDADNGTGAAEDGAEASGDDEGESSSASSTSDGGVDRSLLSRTLESSFSGTLVQQAVQQLKTKYPHADFRRFEIERMPAYAAYDERLTAARNMAGLFVLFGLLGTMIKLNDIVQQIGGAAARDETAADVFLADMGTIMASIGGAFDSSIWGLGIMVFFLVVIGAFDRWMQKKLDALDEAVQSTVVPGLSQLQLMRAPNLSMGDLIDETSGLLTDLNRSVEGMTEGMNRSLSELATEINKMMQDFGSFQNQYAQLNDLINNLQQYTENVGDATRAIEGAGHTLANPINQMNRDLNTTIREYMGTVGAAIESSEADRNALIESFKSVENDLKRQTQRISDIARDSLGEIGEQQDRNVEILEHEIEMLAEQSDVVRSELRAVTEALENANSQELAAVIATLQERMDEGSGSLSTSAGQLSDSAVEISKSADRLRRVSRGLKVSKTSPHSAFEWLYRTVQDARNGST